MISPSSLHWDGRVARVAGVPIAITSLEGAVAWALHAVRGKAAKPAGAIRFVNTYCISLSSTTPDYGALLTGSGVNFPDGAPVAWTARRKGVPARQVRGPSFFETLLAHGVDAGVRHYFFGTDRETLVKLETALCTRFPGLQIAGMAAPPFGTVADIVTDEAVANIAATAPDVVWVGLGAPKQDFVAEELGRRLPGTLCIGVGAAFAFAAGTQPVAPAAMRRLGLEWVHRLLVEPQRLWRRYLFGNSRFIALAAGDLWSSRRKAASL